jgi:predicted transcriptional regulator
MPRKAKHAAGSETSHAAAESIEGAVLNEMQLRVLETIIDSPGMTCDEVEVKLDPMPHQTVSARINELRNTGYIEESGEQRNTRRGRKAVVYKATSKARGS